MPDKGDTQAMNIRMWGCRGDDERIEIHRNLGFGSTRRIVSPQSFRLAVRAVVERINEGITYIPKVEYEDYLREAEAAVGKTDDPITHEVKRTENGWRFVAVAEGLEVSVNGRVEPSKAREFTRMQPL